TKIRMGNGSLVVSVAGAQGQDSAEFIESIDRFLDPFLSTQKAELFQSYVFGKLSSERSELIYHDDELPLRTDIGLDSLLPEFGEDFLSGMREMSSEDVQFKMFYYPFTIRDEQYVICGFVDADIYQASLRKIPFYFIYPLAIIFLLLLVSLPILKFYIMDSNEQVRMGDLQLFGVSFFSCAALITLIIIQFLLWQGEEKRVAKNLNSIAGQIKDRFKEEVNRAFSEMELLDTLIKNDQPRSKTDSSEGIRSYLAMHKNNPSTYYHFERISWIDSSGEQRIKAELHSTPVFTNVAARNYFQVFDKGIPYRLPGNPTKRFGWEPINSWTNGDFNMTISMKGEKYLTALASKMHSLYQVILPVGYGFCIIDESGNVQVHSDQNRNLRENFFRKISSPGKIRGAVASRQYRLANDVVAYGKLNMMAVQPLQPTMPFYLITFYDKGHIVPINMRILIFSLIFCLLFFTICVVLWLTIGWRNSKSNPLLFCSMDFLTWIIPKKKEMPYYFHGSLFVGLYFISVLTYISITDPYKIDHFNILALLMVTPINIVLGLYCIRTAFTDPLHSWNQDVVYKKRYEVLIFVAFHLIMNVFVFGLIRSKYSNNSWFLIFQFIISGVMLMYAVTRSSSKLYAFKPGKTSIFNYNFLLTSIVVCLAVLPSALFTWYAHNQELLQTAKRQQLHMAKSIYERSFIIQEMKGMNDTTLVPTYYLDSLQFSWGIYRANNDRIQYDTCKSAEHEEETFEDFYFAIAEKVGVPYYDRQSYAALQDTTHDKSWRWTRDSLLHLWYLPSLPARQNELDSAGLKCLHIASNLPVRFVFINHFGKLVLLIILIAVFLIALFKWIGRNTEQIFLTRYLRSSKLGAGNSKAGLIGAYFEGKTVPDEEILKRVHTSEKYRDYTSICDEEKLLEYEEEIVEDLKNGNELYLFVWNKFSDKEKYLLFDFAQDGLINYKNSKEIIELINKGIFVVHEERLRIFSPGFRAFILTSVDQTQLMNIQKMYKENSTWQFVRIPLLIALLGIAAVLFFTQQGVFDKLLLVIGGASTLLTVVMRYFGGSSGNGKGE
ncbi:MAG TPA: hypothetical protein VEV87_08030, partial [Chitinophagaceae bacterium]|nr:hypothetical protein [Chitinophagaceae bacterium]